MAENLRRRPYQCVVDEQSRPACNCALRPARIGMLRALNGILDGRLAKQALYVGDAFRFRKPSPVKFHVEPFLQGGEQLDAVERRKPKLLFQMRALRGVSSRELGNQRVQRNVAPRRGWACPAR